MLYAIAMGQIITVVIVEKRVEHFSQPVLHLRASFIVINQALVTLIKDPIVTE